MNMTFNNCPRVEMIQVINGDITYTAEAAPESLHTAQVWTVSRTEVVSAAVTTIKVLNALQIPGANGANLATIFGD